MHFLSLSLQRAGAINCAINGNFSAPKVQELVVARGSTIELLRPDDQTGKLVSVCAMPTFSVVRSLKPFRLHGATKDLVVVGSDSGKLTILEFEPFPGAAGAGGGGAFKVVKSETFGKTGCRRAVPGEYLAVDPKGRAVLVAAVEKQKVSLVEEDVSHGV